MVKGCVSLGSSLSQSSVQTSCLLHLSPGLLLSLLYTFFPAFTQPVSGLFFPLLPSLTLSCPELCWPTPAWASPLRSAQPFTTSLATVFQVPQTPDHICEWQPPNRTTHQAGGPARLPGYGRSPHVPVNSLPGPTCHRPAHRAGPSRPRPCQPCAFLLPCEQ